MFCFLEDLDAAVGADACCRCLWGKSVFLCFSLPSYNVKACKVYRVHKPLKNKVMGV